MNRDVAIGTAYPLAARTLQPLPVGEGSFVAEIYPALHALLDGVGPAWLPVPTGDPVRARLLREAMAPGTPIDPEVALVVSTSGSTGTPKGAMLSAAALQASAAATNMRLVGPGHWLLALPAHHIAGLQVILRALAAGHPPVIVDVSNGFDPAELPSAVRALAAQAGSAPMYTSLVPGQLVKVLEWPDPAPADALSRFAAVLLGGAAADPQLLARAAEAGISVVRTYGASETAGGCVYDGVPLNGTSVEIDSDSRIWLGGRTIALGYRNFPDHPAFARPGWYRTDDAGMWVDNQGLQSAGSGMAHHVLAGRATDAETNSMRAEKRNATPSPQLQVLGRLDSALSVGGLTIMPQVVEQALLTHPAISEAVVTGVPHSRLGQQLAAAVCLAPGVATPELAELQDTVRRQLGAHAAPAFVDVIDTMPLLPGGKPDRLEVARRLQAWGHP